MTPPTCTRPPARLNLVLQDVAKLAARVRGRAPGDLLDTYEAERRPVAECVVTQSQALMAPGASWQRDSVS